MFDRDSLYGDLQANIVRSAGVLCARYEFFRIHDPETFRRFLLGSRGIVSAEPEVAPAPGTHGPSVLLGLTFAGLRALGLSEDRVALLPQPFVEGMANRAQLLGDVGASAPETWHGRFGTGEIHGVLCLGLPTEADPLELTAHWHRRMLDESCATGHLCAEALECALPGTVTLERCFGATQAGLRTEPFGFRDGIGQPRIEHIATSPNAPAPAGGLRLGEFVLGHPDEWDRLCREAAAAEPASLARQAPTSIAGGELALDDILCNGTYMVLRKLEQDVARFRAVFGATPDGGLRAARAVGRFKDGVPVSLPIRGPNALDDFTYENADGTPTAEGNGVPVDSHIRRAHPRSEKNRDLVNLHRIVRRGLPYRESDPYTCEPKQGLLFVCFNSRIDDQFEFIQSVYLNDGSKVGLPSRAVDEISKFVTVRGGEYFLVPSISVLERLGAGDFQEPRGRCPRCELQERRAAAEAELNEHFDPLELAHLPPGLPGQLHQHVVKRALPGPASVWMVGQAQEIVTMLGARSPSEFKVAPYGERIQDMVGPKHGMLTGSDDKNVRHPRSALFQALLPRSDEALVAGIASGVLDALDASRVRGAPIDWVSKVARAIPARFMTHYLGISPPERFPSAIYTKFYYGFPGKVPSEWEHEFQLLEQASGQGAMRQLAFWSQIAFAHTFGNLRERSELRTVARAAVAELNAHLDDCLRTGTKNSSGTVLQRGLERTGGTPSDELRLLLLELAVGSTEILARALTNLMNVLLSQPKALDAVRNTDPKQEKALDRIIHECLRFDPVALALPRRYAGDAHAHYQQGDLVCAMVGVASMDPQCFPAPEEFDANRGGGYLTFGAGLHECPGRFFALAMMREVLRWIARCGDLRRAAGPRGQKIERESLPESLYIRLD